MSSSKNNITIPFNQPLFTDDVFEILAEVKAQKKLSGVGPFTKKCETFLTETLGVAASLLTTSCTHALEMAAMLLDIQPNDEVIVPAFTFVSSANAFAVRGAKPVFADIRPDTLNIDETKIEALITEKTKAIVLVHYAGVACEMDEICAIAEKHNIPIIEDNAHGLFAKYKGRYLGTFGVFATLSFHETKNFSCGEGGALLINDPAYIERAEIIREKGTNRTLFFRGQVDKYTWVDYGSSFVLSELLAGFLWGQLRMWQDIQQKRADVWNFYNATLTDWANANEVQLPSIPVTVDQPSHLFYLLLPTFEKRESLRKYLNANGILAVFHYLPLNASPMGESFGAAKGDCPVTESLSDRLLRLPLFYDITQDQLHYIAATIQSFDF